VNAPRRRLLELGLAIPQILLPRKTVDLSTWAVIACDQFTQDPRYWEQVCRTVGDRASTLKLIYPEVFLETPERQERIAAIHRAMDSYLGGDVFAPPLNGCVYVERDTPLHRRRRGLVVAVDLDRYDWGSQSRSLIRATEGTLPERLPPRMDIRRKAPLESPHILLLIDDKQDSLLGGLAGLLTSAEPAYRGNLMLDSGSITGWPLDREDQWTLIAEGLETLLRHAPDGFLYAVGDGNHSLAAAKGIWEERRSAPRGATPQMEDLHRFALVEIENLHDPAISFEPIHRILFDTDMETLLEALAPLPGLKVQPVEGPGQLCRLLRDRQAPRTRLGLVSGPRCLLLETSAPGLATVALQPLLDRYAGAIDYIHGEAELLRLVGAALPGACPAPPDQAPAHDRAVGILLPPIRKEQLFETVARSGPLPRKSFSMGESVEKRFYLECRRLVP
jgi:hypothetical protein